MSEEIPERKSENQKGFLLKITSYLPILSVFCLGFSIISQSVYYSCFHIDILTYTDLNEIIFNSFTNLLLTIITYISMYFTVRFIIYHLDKNFKNENKKSELLSIKKANISMLVIFLISTLFFYFAIVNLNKKELNYEELKLGCILCYVFVLIVFGIPCYTDLIYKLNDNNHLIFIISFYFYVVLIILSLTIYLSLYEAGNTKKLNTYGTYIKIDTNRIVSTDKYYYIGRTRNFIFFYDVINDYTHVYQNKDVKELALNNKGYDETINQLKKEYGKQIRIDSLKKVLNKK